MVKCLNKSERKLVELQQKAQECVSRKKAAKILKKEKKWQKSLKSYLLRMILIIPHAPLVKFCLNPLALRARYAKIFMIARIVTVCYAQHERAKRAGYPQVVEKSAHLSACYRMLRPLAFCCDLCYINNVGGNVYI